MGSIRWLVAGAVLVVACWAAMVVLARVLPEGLARDLAGFVPACATAIHRLRKDPRVPRRTKVALAVAAAWVLSPVDLIPEFVPVVGPLDDVVVIALVLRYAARSVPRQVLEDAWPGERRLLDRMLARRARPWGGRDPGMPEV